LKKNDKLATGITGMRITAQKKYAQHIAN